MLATLTSALFHGEAALAGISSSRGTVHQQERTAPLGEADAGASRSNSGYQLLAAPSSRDVRVGLYENQPKIFTDETGVASGIFPAILEEIARRARWQLIYVPCEWSACLEALGSGRIDLMPDVAYSPQRDEDFDFHTEDVLSSWSTVYADGKISMSKLSDLNGRRVALLEGSVQQAALEQLMNGFGWSVTIVEAESFEEAFELVADNAADAVVANHFFGDYFYHDYGLQKTQFVFNPVSSYFATASGSNPDLLEAIDTHLRAMKSEPGSAYYEALARWSEKPERESVPQYLVWILGGTGGFLVVAVLGILLLHWQVRVRTRHLLETSTRLRESEERLHQAQKMESLGRLAGGVAHDSNNMLSVIIGYSELALADMDSADPLRGHLLEIHKAAERSREMSGQLLAFARKEATAPKVLDLNATVEDMLTMLRPLIGEDIELAWLPLRGVWPVLADPSQIDQILTNLCVNARDAMAGVGKVTIETGTASFAASDCSGRPEVVPGEFVVLAVSDNGCGMDRETLARVFEPFFTTKEPGRGTGLGLATVYGIVKQHHGFVNVYSEPGKGTTFEINLPRHTDVIPPDGREATASRPMGNGETLLVVEDEMAILRLAERSLSALNYTVLTASSPSEALQAAAAHVGEIGLLITDVVMPEMNGRELAEQLKARWPKLRCLYMSGYTADIISHRMVSDEEFRFIQKPFSTQDLAAKVSAALDESDQEMG